MNAPPSNALTFEYYVLSRFARIFGAPSFKERVKEEERKQALYRNSPSVTTDVIASDVVDDDILLDEASAIVTLTDADNIRHE